MSHAVESRGNLAKIIAASSAGTLIEWYDFYIFGALAFTISEVFFPKGAGAAALLSTLATFAIGFIVRPFGALVFGYLGDKIGRKYTFMVTLLLMGGATFAIGLLPGYETIGAGCCRGWRWVANMAGRRRMWPSTARTASAGTGRVGFRPPPRWGCSSRWASSSPAGG
jgi:MFS family permease